MASRLGVADVDAMLAGMDSAQISEWMAFDLVDVQPEQRAAALITSAILNTMGGGRRTYRESDFLPRRHTPAEEQHESQLKAALAGLAARPAQTEGDD